MRQIDIIHHTSFSVDEKLQAMIDLMFDMSDYQGNFYIDDDNYLKINYCSHWNPYMQEIQFTRSIIKKPEMNYNNRDKLLTAIQREYIETQTVNHWIKKINSIPEDLERQLFISRYILRRPVKLVIQMYKITGIKKFYRCLNNARKYMANLWALDIYERNNRMMNEEWLKEEVNTILDFGIANRFLDGADITRLQIINSELIKLVSRKSKELRYINIILIEERRQHFEELLKNDSTKIAEILGWDIFTLNKKIKTNRITDLEIEKVFQILFKSKNSGK